MKRTSSPAPSCSTQSSTPFALTITGGTLNRRPPVCPGTLPLESGADSERLIVAVPLRNDLQSDRQSFLRPPRRDAQGRALADEVELAGHVEAVVEIVAPVGVPGEVVLVDRASDLRHRRAKEYVEALQDRSELLPRSGSHELDSLEFDGAEGEAVVHQAHDPWIHSVAKLIELVSEDRREVDAPVVDPCVGDVARPADVHLLHDGAGFCERIRRLAHCTLDLGCDCVVTEVEVERDTQALGRAFACRAEVGRWDYGHDVPRVRALGDREEKARVFDRARERTEMVDGVELRREEIEGDSAVARFEADESAPG